jgi:type I restriction enzyme, S subunit
VVDGWRKTIVKDLCEITSSKRIHVADYRPEGVRFYRGKEVIERQKGNLEVSTELFISESQFLEIKRKFGVPQPGDLLLTSVGTLGVPYVVRAGEEFYFKDGNLTWFRNFKNLDSVFLYYWLLSSHGKAELKKCTIGSSQSAFTIVLLKDMTIELPPLPTQRRIASILSAYDDLIENNTRRIKLLEQMAQALYREWFVEFRAPGVKLRKATPEEQKVTGKDRFPAGWEIGRLGDIAQNTRETTETGTHLDDLPYVPIDLIPRQSLALAEARPGQEAKSSLLLFKKSDILFGAMRAYFHKVVIAPFDGVTRATCFVIRPANAIAYGYTVLTLFAESTVDYANTHSRGSTMPYAVWNGVLENMPVVIPTNTITLSFDELVKPMLDRIAIVSPRTK